MLVLAPPPSLPRRAVAAPLYAVFSVAVAVDRVMPEWVPAMPGWLDRAVWWCWTTAERIAPSRASRVFDAALADPLALPEPRP